ncbi:hypothetical protein H4R19_000427 [Coemansia spiralis]|nr:hypothetical protein H4R19_000427 [Coemansia spiralis]
MRKSSKSDISPSSSFGPLDEHFKPSSTRARFEELASTYRSADDEYGNSLLRLDGVMEKKGEIVRLIEMAKDGRLPPTDQIVDAMERLDFGKMRQNATTLQGKRVIDRAGDATRAGTRAFKEINEDDDIQEIIEHLNNVRKKTVDDRKAMARKAKVGAAESKDVATAAGKDFLVLAKGVGTSGAVRRSFADLFRLLSDVMQSKVPTADDVREAAGEGESLVDRMRELATAIRQSPEMRKSLSSLHALYRLTYSRGSNAMEGATLHLDGHPAKQDLVDAYRHAKALFSHLGGGYDMAAVAAALEAVTDMSRKNEGFDKLLTDARSFGDWAMNADMSELTPEEFQTRGQAVIDQSRRVLSDDERATFRTLSDEATDYMRAVQDNPVLVSYKDAMVALAHSITGHGLHGEERADHISELRRDVLATLPLLVQAVRYVPLPRVAGQNKGIEFATDNMVLDLKHFVPEHMSFDIHSEAYPRAGLLKDDAASRSSHGFKTEQFYALRITGIHFVANRVAYYIKKKKGIPRLADKGIADLVVDGRGMDVIIRLRRLHRSEKTGEDAGPSEPPSHRLLDVVDAKVELHTLDIRVRENKHSISSALALALMRPVARRLIARNISHALTSALIDGDRVVAKHSSSAHDFIAANGRKALSSAKDAARRSSQSKPKAKGRSPKSRGKAKDHPDTTTKDHAAHRRDSMVEAADAPAADTAT